MNLNTQVMKIKKDPQDDMIYNIKRNLNHNFYSNFNNFNTINNFNNNNYNNNFNQTSPNLRTVNYITNFQKLPNQTIDDRFNNNNYANNFNRNNSNEMNDIRVLPMNINNERNREMELPGANNTIGYAPLRKPLSSNIIDVQNFQRINSNNQPRLSNQNVGNTYSFNMLNRDDDNEDDKKYHDLSQTMNFLKNRNTQPMSFEQALKLNQINQNNQNNNNNGRVTVKKLPPLSNNQLNNGDHLENAIPINRQLSGQMMNTKLNRPTLGINDVRNTFGNNTNIKIKKLDSKGMPIENSLNPNLINNQKNTIIPNGVYNPNINAPPMQPNIKQEIPNQMINQANINRNYIAQNQPINPLFIQNRQQPQGNTAYLINQQNQINPQLNINQNNYIPQNQNQIINNNINPNPNLNRNLISERNNMEPLRNEALKEEKVSQNDDEERNEQNNEEEEDKSMNNNVQDNNTPKKKNVDISYNDFDDSGWIKNYGGVSRPGKDATGKQKTNQDTLVSLTNINNIKDFNIFGVLDGHGPDGHYVSNFASEFIPQQIINAPEIKELSDPELIYKQLKDNNCKTIINAFLACDEQLKSADFDVYDSGTTCVLIIHAGNHIICANVGDSRGIVVYDDKNMNEDPNLNESESAQLSIDYKPEILQEKNRILMSGGVVEQMKNAYGQGVGPFRVWARGEDYPGLAMSRSIGDLKGKKVGVIAEPGIMEYDLCESTKYIVAGSDGVWEFLNNEIVKDIGKKYYLENNPSEFCHQIVNNSVFQWQKNEVIIDDITVLTVFF